IASPGRRRHRRLSVGLRRRAGAGYPRQPLRAARGDRPTVACGRPHADRTGTARSPGAAAAARCGSAFGTGLAGALTQQFLDVQRAPAWAPFLLPAEVTIYP